MIAIDALVHNSCTGPAPWTGSGLSTPTGLDATPAAVAQVIETLAERIDARAFNPDFPACFPRFVQSAIWRLCSASELNLCNGNRIDDRGPCQNDACPAFAACDRVALCPT